MSSPMMNRPLQILEDVKRRCQSLGIEVVRVGDLDIENVAKAHFGDIEIFLRRLEKVRRYSI